MLSPDVKCRGISKKDKQINVRVGFLVLLFDTTVPKGITHLNII